MEPNSKKYDVIVGGTSAGGFKLLSAILPELREDLDIPVIIVQHVQPESDDFMITHLDKICRLKVKEAEEKEPVEPGTIYFAPPDYHLLVEQDRTFSISMDMKVNFSRPSIDVLFESAADVYREKTIGFILSGANSDGAKGLKKIADFGGTTIIQDPESSEFSEMPGSATVEVSADFIVGPDDISGLLNRITKQNFKY